MAWLKTYMPIAIELKSRNLDCVFLSEPSGKYSCCYKRKNQEKFNEMLKKYEIMHVNASQIKNLRFAKEDILFSIEGNVGNKNVKKISASLRNVILTNCTDFRFRYDEYVKRDHVEKIIFGSKGIATFYNKLSNKNCYLGLPKFDICDTKENIYQKFNLKKEEKYCLIIAPRRESKSGFPWQKTVSQLREKGYKVIVKSRGKDSYKSLGNKYYDHYFEDQFWFTHDTIDLLMISDLMINTGSLAIEEAIFTSTPVINFDVKNHLHLAFLYDYNFVRNIKNNQEFDFEKIINNLLSERSEYEFEKCINENFRNIGQSSKAIIESVCKK